MNLCPFFATMSAIIPKLNSYFMNSTHNFKEYSNRLRQLQGKNFICYILKKGNFYYVGIYNNK
jgi:hypothetical protein